MMGYRLGGGVVEIGLVNRGTIMIELTRENLLTVEFGMSGGALVQFD